MAAHTCKFCGRRPAEEGTYFDGLCGYCHGAYKLYKELQKKELKDWGIEELSIGDWIKLAKNGQRLSNKEITQEEYEAKALEITEAIAKAEKERREQKASAEALARERLEYPANFLPKNLLGKKP